jgi:hypothetical protein
LAINSHSAERITTAWDACCWAANEEMGVAKMQRDLQRCFVLGTD